MTLQDKELKTLKDMKNYNELPEYSHVRLLSDEEIKEEAIKWVKEDFQVCDTGDVEVLALIDRWMKRLDISEEDLHERR